MLKYYKYTEEGSKVVAVSKAQSTSDTIIAFVIFIVLGLFIIT